MAAIQFRSSAQTKFDDANEMIRLAMEQGNSAFDNVNKAVTTVGEDYTKQNDAALQSMINQQSYADTQDPEKQAALAQQIQDFSSSHGNMANTEDALLDQSKFVDTMAARDLNSFNNQAAKEDRFTKLQKEADDKLISDTAYSLADPLRILKGIDQKTNPEGYAKAKGVVDSILNQYDPILQEQMMIQADNNARDKATKDEELAGLRIGNLADTQKMIDGTNKTAGQINHWEESIAVQRERIVADTAGKTSGSASMAAETIVDGTPYTTAILDKDGQINPAQMQNQLETQLTLATDVNSYKGKDAIYTDVNAFKEEHRAEINAKFETSMMQQDFFKVLDEQNLSQHDQMAIMDGLLNGAIRPDSWRSGEVFGIGGYKGHFDKEIVEYLEGYHKDVLPKRQEAAISEALRQGSEVYNRAPGNKGDEGFLKTLGVGEGRFEYFNLLTPAQKKASGYTDKEYEDLRSFNKFSDDFINSKGTMQFTLEDIDKINKYRPEHFKVLLNNYPNAKGRYRQLMEQRHDETPIDKVARSVEQIKKDPINRTNAETKKLLESQGKKPEDEAMWGSWSGL